MNVELNDCIADTSDWDSIIIKDKNTGKEIKYLCVGDKNMLSFVYFGDRIYFSNHGESHNGAIWNYFCLKKGLHPERQKKYDWDEIDEICTEYRKCTTVEGRVWNCGVYIIQILGNYKSITENKIIDDICSKLNILKNKCYILDEQIDENNVLIKKINENKNNMKRNVIRLTESDLHRVIKESVKKILKEDFYDNMYNLHEFEHFNNDDNNDYYTAYVVVNNGDGAVLSNYSENDLEDAIEEARELARKYKFSTFYVCGCDNKNEYSYDPDDENNTIVYCTDEEF